MLSYEDNTIKLILIIRLSGHIELSEKIIYNKNIFETEEIRKEYIERDFFNWLTYDLNLRQKLKLNEINQNDLLEYYQKNNENLGLIPGEYRRAKRLCDIAGTNPMSTPSQCLQRWRNSDVKRSEETARVSPP